MKVIDLKPGTRIQHRGTQAWGEILQASPQRDGTYEYLVQKDKPLLPNLPNLPSWWASYHIGAVVPPQLPFTHEARKDDR